MECKLTPKQKKVLLLYAFKLNYEQIGEHLGFSQYTAKNHLLKVYEVLGVESLSDALIDCLLRDEITVADIKLIYCTLPRP